MRSGWLTVNRLKAIAPGFYGALFQNISDLYGMFSGFLRLSKKRRLNKILD